MSTAPASDPDSPDFPGDSSPQPPFGFKDTLRSLALWSVGVPHLVAWTVFIATVSKYTDIKNIDRAIKFMTKAVPKIAGVNIEVLGQEKINPQGTYVYITNHVNIFDMFAIYQAIPQFTRSLEHIDHFSWPIFGRFITAAGQIPVDPNNAKVTAKGLKQAYRMLKNGDSLVVLPEGSRTLDGSVGKFFPGAFRLAIRANVPVIPMAIKGGRYVSRRGDWRIRPGKMQVIIGEPISTNGLKIKDANNLAKESRKKIIALLS